MLTCFCGLQVRSATKRSNLKYYIKRSQQTPVRWARMWEATQTRIFVKLQYL